MVFPKLVLDERRIKKDGTFPLVIRITYHRQTANFPLGISVTKQHWDEQNLILRKSHPNFKKLHTDINNAYYRVQKSTETLIDENRFTLKALKEKLCIQPVIEVEPPKVITFNEYANQLVNSLYVNNKVGNAIVYQTAINRLLTFVNFSELTFEDLDYRLLENFKNKLIADGVKPNTVSNYFRTLRAIFNRAIKEKLVSRDLYYFTDIHFKPEKTPKRAITKEELVQLSNYTTFYRSQEWQAQNLFLLSFNLIGMSFTDMAYLKPGNIVNGRLEYRRRKTGKHYSIKLTSQALKVFSYYSRMNSKYLLPVLPDNIMEDSIVAKKLILQWIKTTNKYLGYIVNNLSVSKITTYVARHTWATMAKRLGYSNELIAEALGHEYGNRITAIYLDNFEQETIDSLNNTVSALLN